MLWPVSVWRRGKSGVALTALISAHQESDEPGGPLRAVLPLAGRTLIERLAKLAALAGAR